MKNPRFLILVFGALLANCQQNGPTNPPSDWPTYRIVPDSGLVGSVIRIYGKEFYPDGHNIVRFTGTLNFSSDSGNSNYLMVTVPFDAKSGPIIVITNSGDVQISGFRVVEAYDSSKVTVKWWNLPPPNPWLDSCQTDLFGIWRCWECTRSNDTITLILPDFRNSQSETKTEVIKFKDNGPTALPSYLTMYQIRSSASSIQVDTLQRGIIKIRSWDATGIIEGQVFVPPWTFFPYFVDYFEVKGN